MVVIPKSVNPKRIAENFKATQVLLDADEIKRIRAIDKNMRLFRVRSLFCCLEWLINVINGHCLEWLSSD
jgi:diketogulonate reductase-like aldo/keto reductase